MECYYMWVCNCIIMDNCINGYTCTIIEYIYIYIYLYIEYTHYYMNNIIRQHYNIRNMDNLGTTY